MLGVMAEAPASEHTVSERVEEVREGLRLLAEYL
jgi:hypothetical protein